MNMDNNLIAVIIGIVEGVTEFYRYRQPDI